MVRICGRLLCLHRQGSRHDTTEFQRRHGRRRGSVLVNAGFVCRTRKDVLGSRRRRLGILLRGWARHLCLQLGVEKQPGRWRSGHGAQVVVGVKEQKGKMRSASRGTGVDSHHRTHMPSSHGSLLQMQTLASCRATLCVKRFRCAMVLTVSDTRTYVARTETRVSDNPVSSK